MRSLAVTSPPTNCGEAPIVLPVIPGPETKTFVASSDAYVLASDPNSSFGTGTSLIIESGADAYLRFDLATLPATAVIDE